MNMNNIMKQAQAMQKKMMEMQDKIASTEYVGAAGAGAVEITINGKNEMLKLKIDPSIVDKDDIEMLEDLIVAAYNDAKSKCEADSQGDLSSMFGGMKLPPGFKLPF